MKIGKEIKIGLIVIVAVFCFIYGLNFLKGKNIFTNRTHFLVVYDNVDGITESNPVFFHGYRIGKIDDISFTNEMDGRILVDFTISENDLKIPVDSRAKIFSDGVLGNKAIEIILGKSSKYAESGDTLIGDFQPSMTSELTKQLVPVKDKAELLLTRVDSLLYELTSILTPNTKGNLRHSVENLDAITLNINGLVDEQRKRLNSITANIESISKNLRDNNDKITAIMANFKNISDSLSKANITTALNNANLALSHTAEVMEKINSGKGSLGMLVNNDTLYYNLRNASKNLDKLMIDLKEHPKKYVHFSIFGKKEKTARK